MLKLPFCISDGGRQWATVIENWLIHNAGFQSEFRVCRLYIRRTENGERQLMIAKLTDDLLISGHIEDMKEFSRTLADRFLVRETIMDDETKFNESQFRQAEYCMVKLSMQ